MCGSAFAVASAEEGVIWQEAETITNGSIANGVGRIEEDVAAAVVIGANTAAAAAESATT